ncbi:MAG: tetratricopeptide repeat protein [Bacteroidales bacterium]|jgi:tetratricopeptide (TPR) repeat protein|nr:tetratricopeptide repeat protein [Bacteroidales bacterium]
MNKLSCVVFLLFAMSFAHSQKKELNNAYTNYGNGYYDRAQTAIDKAILNEETKNEAKTWLYRGNIYLQLAVTKEKEYIGLCTNCGEIAYDSYLKALELDPNVTAGMNIADPRQGLKYCANVLYDEAIKFFEQQKYEESFSVAEKAYKADRTQQYIVYLYAYTAELTKRMDIAKTNYNDLVQRKSKDIMVYVRLVNIYKLENDTAKVLNVIKAGEPIFFSGDSINVDYAVAYSIALSWAGKVDEATDIMNRALEKYPTNHTLLVNYGSELSNQRNYEEAEKYFKRALELQPNDLIAIYNLGNCYYNNYVERRKAMDDIVDNDEYRREEEKNSKLLEQARPYLEQAHELDPKDINTLQMLRLIYANMRDTENELKAVEEKINALGK